jgi:hypothetical protein
MAMVRIKDGLWLSAAEIKKISIASVPVGGYGVIVQIDLGIPSKGDVFAGFYDTSEEAMFVANDLAERCNAVMEVQS